MNPTYRSTLIGGAALAAAVALASCGGGGGGTTAQTGSLSLAITDAQIAGLPEKAKVWITFDGVELKPQDGPAIQHVIDPPMVIDLLSLTGYVSEPLIVEKEVPAGSYNWIRLSVQSSRTELLSYVDMTGDGPTPDDDDVPLFIPSGDQSGLKLNAADSKVVVAPGGLSEFTIDWDARRSVFVNKGDPYYRLRPVIRIVNIEVGSISGTVTTDLVESLSDQEGATCAVYAFPGPFSPLDDIDEMAPADDLDEADGPEPISSANLEPVVVDETVIAWSYILGFLVPGDYTLGLTCDAEIDHPLEDNDDTVIFGDQAEVEVEANIEKVVDFPTE